MSVSSHHQAEQPQLHVEEGETVLEAAMRDGITLPTAAATARAARAKARCSRGRSTTGSMPRTSCPTSKRNTASRCSARRSR